MDAVCPNTGVILNLWARECESTTVIIVVGVRGGEKFRCDISTREAVFLNIVRINLMEETEVTASSSLGFSEFLKF